jgi:hypothetical protein
MSKSPPLPPIIDLTDEEVSVKKKPSLEQMSIGTQQLWLKLGGRIMTGGSGESSMQSRQTNPGISTVQFKQKVPPTLKQRREEWWLKLQFVARDTVRLVKWLKKLPDGAPIPLGLVQVVTLMNCAGQLVETMMGFVPWDLCLVSNRGRIMAESQTIDLDPEFSGDPNL